VLDLVPIRRQSLIDNDRHLRSAAVGEHFVVESHVSRCACSCSLGNRPSDFLVLSRLCRVSGDLHWWILNAAAVLKSPPAKVGW
jgi:hypothetical protein